MKGQVLLRLRGEARRGHDHARGTKAALKRLGIEERLLHRMEFAVAGKPLERGDLPALGPERGNEATVDRLAIEPDRAGAAIAGITPFFHAKPAKASQKGSQALAGKGVGREGFPVDPKSHGGFLTIASSWRVPNESARRSNESSVYGGPATHARRRGTC